MRSSARSGASRLEKGSSSRITEGRGASARASATRCSWPPDSVAGMRPSKPDRPTSASASATRARAVRGAARQAVGDVAGDAEVREEGRVLEDHADAAPLGRDEGRRAGQDPIADADLAGVGALQAGDAAQEGGLAAAARAEQRDQPARRHRQVDAPQHLGGAEGLRQAGDRDRLSRTPGALRCTGRFPVGETFGRPYRPVWRGAIGAIRPAGRTGRRPRGRRSPSPRRRSGWCAARRRDRRGAPRASVPGTRPCS